jgi:hypothetical protein
MSASLIARQSQGLKLVVNTFGDQFCGSSGIDWSLSGLKISLQKQSAQERSELKLNVNPRGSAKTINNLSVCLQAASEIVQCQLGQYFRAR